METTIRHYAQLSIARGCGFGALAIATVMVGSASDLSLFFRAGGFSTLLMCFILLIMAARADHVPVNRTEVWILLPKENRPPIEIAAPLIAEARKDYLLRFAYVAAIVASVELGLDLALSIGRLA